MWRGNRRDAMIRSWHDETAALCMAQPYIPPSSRGGSQIRREGMPVRRRGMCRLRLTVPPSFEAPLRCAPQDVGRKTRRILIGKRGHAKKQPRMGQRLHQVGHKSGTHLLETAAYCPDQRRPRSIRSRVSIAGSAWATELFGSRPSRIAEMNSRSASSTPSLETATPLRSICSSRPSNKSS